jgi:hypothetical protein
MTIETPAPKPPSAPAGGAPRGDWRIDARTRRVGLRGVARARAALEATGPRPGSDGQPNAA